MAVVWIQQFGRRGSSAVATVVCVAALVVVCVVTVVWADRTGCWIQQLSVVFWARGNLIFF